MARKQRRDSVQEKAVTRDAPKAEALIPKEHYVAYVSPEELQLGDVIVTVFKRQKDPAAPKRAFKAEKVKEIDHFVRGCRQIHVNNDQCWDRCAQVPIVASMASSS